MNKHLPNSLRALFLSLAVLMSLPMLAVEVEIDGINYDLNAEAKQATVIKKSSGKYSGKVVIPESVEFKGVTHSVTSIRFSAFDDCSGLTLVTIPNSVTSIGGFAFSDCSRLTSVTIPNSVTSIGEWAFHGCDGLTSVTIGNSVESIGDAAFNGCTGLTSVHISDIAAWCNIDFDGSDSNPLDYAEHLYLNGEKVKDLVIPNSVTSIGDYAFWNCSGLTSVTIPNSVTNIGEWAFSYCYGLTSVTIGNSVTSLGKSAFAGCSSLTSVTIGNSVRSIADYAFWKCSGLTSVTIPNSVTSLGESAFRGCSGLTSVTIGNSVRSIADGTFYGCSGLTSVTIPNSVTSIGSSAFYDCSGLTSVTIPNSVTSIGEEAFTNCSELLDVYCYAKKVPSTKSNAFDGSYPEYITLHVPDASIDSYKAKTPWSGFGKIVALTTEVDGINYFFNTDTKEATVIAKSSGKYSGEVVIPESVEYEGAAYSVTSIGEYAFYKCSGLTSVTIGNSVTSIGESAFNGCSGLTSVTIPNSVTSIGYGAFAYCYGLTSVTIPNSVTSIGDYAFYDCSGLTSVTIPNSVTSIGSEAFASCSNLLDVYCYAENVPSTKSSAFDGSYPENATLHVPDASIDSYKAAEPWSGFGKIVALTDEETDIDVLKQENGMRKSEIYDLSGRRLQKARKGVNIINGKKVMIK